MLIRRKLRLASVLLVLAAAAIALTVSVTMHRADNEVARAGGYTRIEEKGFALAVLAVGFKEYPNERRITQWHDSYASMGELLAGVEAESPAEAFYLDSIKRRFREAGAAFDRLERLRFAASEESLAADQAKRASDEMQVNLFQMTDQAKLLVASSMAKALSAERKSTAITLGLIGVLVVLFLGTTTLTSAAIMRSLSALGQGVREVEAGNLDHRVDVPGRDEFAALAVGFNRMSGRIKSSQDALARQAEELRKANEGLRAANAEMEAFSYSVSHDLRSPLRTIEGFSQIILENYSDKIDERGQDYLQRTRNAVMRMEKLIDDILRLSRLSRVSMIHEMVDLSGLAQSVVAGLREREPDRKVEVAIQPGLTIAGDRELLRAAMENLIGNAWKFTGKKEDARIEVGGLPDDGEVIFYVRDNGAGFNKAYADKLFKPFQRLHSEKEFPGTGIGLALVHRIASRHGGGVRAESEPGQGATFYLSLPAKGGAYDRTEDSARRG